MGASNHLVYKSGASNHSRTQRGHAGGAAVRHVAPLWPRDWPEAARLGSCTGEPIHTIKRHFDQRLLASVAACCCSSCCCCSCRCRCCCRCCCCCSSTHQDFLPGDMARKERHQIMARQLCKDKGWDGRPWTGRTKVQEHGKRIEQWGPRLTRESGQPDDVYPRGSKIQ